MTTNSIKPEPAFTEAPASWNTRYVTPEGFTCQITIRGESGRDLLEKAGVALSFLLEHGYKPEAHGRPQRHNHRNGQGSRKACPIHQCEMKRYEKDGKAWFAHKTSAGGWCHGTQK
jgi:hypothetical protein